MNERDETVTKISSVLGLYKAEWLNADLFKLFTEPGYFSELKTPRPCVLIGGRGTGKTTVLRGLSYQGQFAFGESKKEAIKSWPFFGLYIRVNTNRVTAFRGPELSMERWQAYFAHYMNLLFCSQMLEFVSWYELHTGEGVVVSEHALKLFRATLNLPDLGGLAKLSNQIQIAFVDFEASINTVADMSAPSLSMQGAPLDALAKALLSSPQLAGKQFFFLIDEFENFEDYQQRVLNTIIKHATSDYTFKVGVRELGWRERSTLNSNEQLTSPADYARISISEVLDSSRFKTFAEKVLLARLGGNVSGGVELLPPAEMFPGYSSLDEADQLLDGAEKSRLQLLLKARLSSETLEAALALPPGIHYFLEYTAKARQEPIEELVRLWLANDATLKNNFNNHFHASLYAIRTGKRGIRKYYCGWDEFLALCEGNIRYLLELVHAAFRGHIESGGLPEQPISQKLQTEAAQAVGRKNLSELEGLSVDGARLTKLLLSLGRVFQVLAESPAGHTPEANQFHLREEAAADGVDDKASELLKQAVMHLALVRFSGSKPLDERDTRAYDYMIHPIFAPFFVFSHRKKRKIQLTSTQLLSLIDRPRDAIKETLEKNNRTELEALPDQLRLFGDYYA
ncbi:hypothetical protein [Stenotrophomonas sp. TWI587]|uniref:ORC-CDC6 family AAA ATPase n=1 Tax=Stenotrophomonas sp. TWI587 TaxID=3136783 RepID=UPI0013107616